jgi:hypothetical protein
MTATTIYEFNGPSGRGITRVKADNEEDARDLAMVERWGPPEGFCKHPYQGRGLVLVSKSEAAT